MRKANSEYDHSHGNRFSNALDIHQRFESIVENNENQERYSNFIKAYKRYPYPIKGGKMEPNFGQFEFLINKEVDRYVDIITERKQWFDIVTLEGKNDKQESEWSKSISKYFHKYCISPWDEASENSYKDAFKMKMFGAGIEYWENSIDLYPNHKDNSEFFPDENAGMNPNTWDMCFVREKWTAVELYTEIEDKEKAKLNGWNRKAVMEAIKKACGDTFDGVSSRSILDKFSQGEVRSTDQATEIYLVDAYVKEYDPDEKGNQISRYTFTESGEKVTDSNEEDRPSVSKFLRFQDRVYEKFSNVASIRTDLVVDAFYDSASFAETIYIYCRFYDKAMNKIIRQGIRRNNVYLNSDNPDEQRRLSELDHEDEFIVLPSETVIKETNLRAGDAKVLTEAVRQLKIDTEAGSGAGLVTGSQNVKGRAITASEAQIQSSENQSTSITRHKVFADNDSSLGRELYRRFISGGRPNSPEAKNRKRFMDKMKSLEIPKEAFSPDNVIIRSVINPSAASPHAKLESAKIIVGALHVYSSASTEGERRAAESMIAAVVGWQMVPFYIPEESSSFEEDQIFASGRENSDLDDPFVNPNNLRVRSDDVHPVHISMHLADMEFKLDVAEQILQTIEQLPSNARITQLGKVSDILKAQDNKGGHVEAHLQMLATASETVGDPTGIIESSQSQLKGIRERESKLEKALAQILDKVNQGDESMANLEFEHAKRMFEAKETHELAMQKMALMERSSKSQANAMGSEINKEQKLRHKEEDHILDTAIKANESEQERTKSVDK